MEAAVALEAAAPILESIPNPPWGCGQVGPGLGVVVIRYAPISDQSPILLSSAHGWY